MEGKDGKTEQATAKKRSKQREEGNLCVSPEINSMSILVLGLIGIRLAAGSMMEKICSMMIWTFKFNNLGDWSVNDVGNIYRGTFVLVGVILAPFVLPVMLGAVISNVAQTGPYFSTKTLKWKLSSISPLKGIKKMFSMQSAVKLFISLLKIGLVVGIVYIIVRSRFYMFPHLANIEGVSPVEWIFKLIFRISMTIAVVFSTIAAIDWAFRKRKHEMGMMMSKQEVKEERKQEEISPHIKRAQMKKMREFTMMRMMAAVPEASVIVTNPTHVAIALKYDPETMDAPEVIAKGLRLTAQRIKKIARENNVPILERPELARGLYKYVKLGSQIPSKFYETVAEVLAFIHRLGRPAA